jgi:hypothetical protein
MRDGLSRHFSENGNPESQKIPGFQLALHQILVRIGRNDT